jgi:hypothetical protein
MEDSLSITLRDLELSLLHDTFSAKQEELLAPELREIGADGQIHQRSEICAWLNAKSPDARWDIQNFQVSSLAPGLALCTYWAKQIAPHVSDSKGSMHSSLWKLSSDGCWQMLFHQATKCTAP